MEENRPLLERDIQTFLERNIQLLGEGLTLVGREHPVPFGRIDLLAKDSRNRLVAIELKLGAANRDAVGQLQSYMGALQVAKPETFVRGVLVAKSMDAGAEAALRVARDIQFFLMLCVLIFIAKEKEKTPSTVGWISVLRSHQRLCQLASQKSRYLGRLQLFLKVLSAQYVKRKCVRLKQCSQQKVHSEVAQAAAWSSIDLAARSTCSDCAAAAYRIRLPTAWPL